MNQKAKMAVLTGLNLVIGVTGVASFETGAYAEANLNRQSSDVLQSDTREFEASFLNVPAKCKVSHAAFDAVEVAIRQVPADIRAIHAEVERA